MRRLVTGALVLAVLGPTPAYAHGVGGRGDLPLPAWQFAWGAAVAVVLSFAALGLLWHKPLLGSLGDRTLGWAEPLRPFATVLRRVLGLTLFVITLGAAFTGGTDGANLAPVTLFVVFWVGMQIASAVFGDIWRALNPLETLAIALPEKTHDEASLIHSHWPALVGLGGFLWLELAYHSPASPRTLGWLMAGYALVMVAAAGVFGRQWLRTSEGFAVLFGLLAALSPFTRVDGRPTLRMPLSGLSSLDVRGGTTAVVLTVLGGTTFDGLTRTSTWRDVVDNRTGWSLSAVNSIGLVATIAIVAGLYLLAVWGAARVTGADQSDLRVAYLPSLIPITLAYAIAHYFSLLVFEGQDFLIQLSDPFDRGWDLFGTRDDSIDFLIVSAGTIAWVQAAAIVIGHIAGVIFAHDRSLERFSANDALRSQYPMLAVMVTYTIAGLWLLMNA